MKSTLFTMLRGFIIGSSMSVPGVSGGTMAIVLGIYDKLIESISRFAKDVRSNVIFLLKFCVGAGLGILALSNLIELLLEKAPVPVSFFFLGAVIGGIPALLGKTRSGDSGFRVSSVVYFLLGVAIVVSIDFIPTGTISITSGSGIAHYLMLLVTGIIVALALVLPGISTSHMLLVLGMYDAMLAAINRFDVVYVGILGVVTLIGVFLITRPLEWTMKEFPRQTYCVILGFVLGSTWDIFRDKVLPAVPAAANYTWWVPSVILSAVTFAAGVAGVMALSRFSND